MVQIPHDLYLLQVLNGLGLDGNYLAGFLLLCCAVDYLANYGISAAGYYLGEVVGLEHLADVGTQELPVADFEGRQAFALL
jgi:hypothetical protein